MIKRVLICSIFGVMCFESLEDHGTLDCIIDQIEAESEEYSNFNKLVKIEIKYKEK